MAEILRYVHFLTQPDRAERPGWYAPAEPTTPDQQGSSYAVPVHEEGRLYSEYRVDVARYHGSGDFQIQSHLLRSRLGCADRFELAVGDRIIAFHAREIGGRRRAFPYYGHLAHPDFQHSLVAIEPVHLRNSMLCSRRIG
jgi:hypothetical protein